MPDLREIARWTARPITPGEYLRHLLAYLGATQEELADAMETSRFTVNQIATGKRTVTPAMAMRLSKATGTSIDIWLNLQRDVDLFDAFSEQRGEIEAIIPLREAGTPAIQAVGTDLELLCHRRVGEVFPALERSAAAIRRQHSRGASRLQVAVFGLDNLEHVDSTYGTDCAKKMLDAFCDHLGQLSARIDAPVYHCGFGATAVVIADEPERADELLEKSFAGIPTVIAHGKETVKMTVSGGIATAGADDDVLDAAVTAAELMQNLSHYRPGIGEHLWTRKFRGR